MGDCNSGDMYNNFNRIVLPEQEGDESIITESKDVETEENKV